MSLSRRSLLPFILSVAALLLAGPATPASAAEGSAATEYQRGIEELRAGRTEAGLSIMVKLVDSGDYQSLGPVEQRRVLPMAAALVGRTDPAKAYEYLGRAVAYPEPELFALTSHASLALFLEHDTDAVDSLVALRKRTPTLWTDQEDRSVGELSRRFRRANDREAEYDFLNRFYTAGYRTSTDKEPDYLWLRFVELLLASGEPGRAASVAGRIRSPQVLARMRIDRRFDPLVAVNPALLDVRGAITIDLEDSKTALARFPRSLRVRLDYLNALYQARQYEEMASFADSVITIAAAAKDKPAFDDAREINWIWDYKARALAMLHRYDDAEKTWLIARELPEWNGTNVSQAINLAELYANLERFDDALKTLESVGRASLYGKIQMEVVRFRAAYRRDDRAALEASLEFMRTNRAEAPMDYIESSLLAGREQDAATSLLELLEGESTRGMALSRVQRFSDVDRLPPLAARIEAAVRDLAKQPGMAAAIDKWGRIEDVPLPSTLR